MDAELFVQNVEYWCKLKGEPPTVACKNSGAGKDLISNLKRGSFPSVAKVYQLAQYLGCTVSDLLGDCGAATQVIDDRYAPFIDLFAELSPEDQNGVVGEMLRRKNQK